MTDVGEEALARKLAWLHFDRKQWRGHCAKDERTAWLVEKYWPDWRGDARTILAFLASRMTPATLTVALEAIYSEEDMPLVDGPFGLTLGRSARSVRRWRTVGPVPEYVAIQVGRMLEMKNRGRL